MPAMTTTCDVYPLQAPVALGAAPVGPRTLTGIPCGLQNARTTAFWIAITTNLGGGASPRYLYINKGTDVRFDVTTATVAYIECPSMSGVFYAVIDVQDMFKGSPLEVRRCVCIPQRFPSPIP